MLRHDKRVAEHSTREAEYDRRVISYANLTAENNILEWI